MDSLPIEIKLKILLESDYSTILRVSCLNSEFHSLCQDESLWKDLFWRDFHHGDFSFISWRQAYEQAWERQRKINSFARRIISEYLTIKSRYVQMNLMTQDLVEVLNRSLKDLTKSRVVEYTALKRVRGSIVEIVLGDQSRSNTQNYWEYRMTTNLCGFLEDLGYTVNDDSESSSSSSSSDFSSDDSSSDDDRNELVPNAAAEKAREEDWNGEDSNGNVENDVDDTDENDADDEGSDEEK